MAVIITVASSVKPMKNIAHPVKVAKVNFKNCRILVMMKLVAKIIKIISILYFSYIFFLFSVKYVRIAYTLIK